MTAIWSDRLKDSNVCRWFEAMALSSRATAEERIRILHRYCVSQACSPAQLAERAKTDRRAVEDALQDFVTDLRKKGKSSGYAENYVKAVKSWLLHNDIALVRKIRIGDRGATPTLVDERIPNKDELRRTLQAASDRGKGAIALCAFGGLRPQVLGNRDGTDGLRLKDLPELEIRDGVVRFKKVPAMVRVRQNLSKVRRTYVTFVPDEACQYIVRYMERRIALGETLGPESPVIRAQPGFERKGRSVDSPGHGSPCLETQAITKEIRSALRAAGIPFRPYVLRSYFMTNLEMAEREGKITRQDLRLFAGRVADIDRRYTTGKHILPPDVIEALRKAYAASANHLTTRPDLPSQEEYVFQLAMEMMRDPTTRKAFEASLRSTVQRTLTENIGTYQGKRDLFRRAFGSWGSGGLSGNAGGD